MAFLLRRLARFLYPKAKQRWQDRKAAKAAKAAKA